MEFISGYLSELEVYHWLTRNWLVVFVWSVICTFLIGMYINSKMPMTEGSLRTVFTNLRRKLWYKPRGYVMGRKTRRIKEKHEREIVFLHILLAIEQLYVKGMIHRATRDKYVDEFAFRFSDPSMFVNEGRLKIIKAKIKAAREARNAPMTLKAAGFPASITPEDRPPVVSEKKEEGVKKKFVFVRAA